MSVRQHNSALAIDIILSVWHFLTQLESLPICILNRNTISLISTCPYDKVPFLDIFALFFNTLSLDHANSLLLPPHDLQVQILGVPSQPRERVQIPILLAELVLLELIVAVFLRIRHLVIEHFYLLAVENLYVALAVVRQLREIKLPIVVVKETETDAKTVARLRSYGRAVVFLFIR
jgi:hypothetical protein